MTFELLTLTIVILAMLLLFRRHNNPQRQWRNRMQLQTHQQQFDLLYAHVNGFLLSRQARIKQDSTEYVYGEIEFEPFIALLSLCPVNENSIFYDLGCGAGKAVLASAMVYTMQKYCGIECLKPLYEVSCAQAEKLKGMDSYHEQAQRIEFIHADFMTMDLSDASIVFINATAFFGDRWQHISRHLEQLAPGSVVISTSKKLFSAQFALRKETVVGMSWGLVKVYLQTKEAS